MSFFVPTFAQLESSAFARFRWLMRTLYYSQTNTLKTIHPEQFTNPLGIQDVSFFGLKVTNLNEPDYVRQALVENHRKLVKGSLFQRVLGPSLGKGLLTIEGTLWKRHRKLMNPAFHEQSLRRVLQILDDRAAHAVAELDGQLDGQLSGQLDGQLKGQLEGQGTNILDVNAWTSKTTMDLVMRALFSSDLGGREKAISNDIGEILHMVGRIDMAEMVGAPKWVPRRRRGKRLTSVIGRVNDALAQVLNQRLNDPALDSAPDPAPSGGDGGGGGGSGGGDLLDMLLVHKVDADATALSPDEMRDEILTMFAAGHETTALALGWALLLLAQHPDAQRKAAAEAQQMLSQASVSAGERIKACPFIEQVFCEALRLYPPAYSILREAQEDIDIRLDHDKGTHRIAAGRTLFIPITVIHRNPYHWNNPDAFEPERFNPDQGAGRHPLAFMPFGAGPRACIGKHVAMAEGVLVLAHLLARFAVETVDATPPEPIGKITMRPQRPIRLAFTPR